jgi:long-chain acyl-CoA synthetase
MPTTERSDPDPVAPRVTLRDADTLPALFRARVRATPGAEAYCEFDPRTQRWQAVDWSALAGRVDAWIAALAALQLPAASRVAILLPNSVAAVCADLAALSLGHVPVPLHAMDTPGSLAFVVADSGAAVLVVQHYETWHRIAELGPAQPALRQVIVTGHEPLPGDDATGAERRLAMRVTDWLDAATAAPPAASQEAGRAAAPRPQDLAAIVYTSGTTGRPKGVMLTHANVLANLRAALGRVQARSDDRFLSFLPLSHTFERTVGYYLPMATGSAVSFARGPAHLPEDFASQRPTVLVSVPRIYERVVAKMQQQRAASGAVAQRAFDAAVAAGWRRFRRTQRLRVEETVPAWRDALLWSLIGARIARRVQAGFGGRLRVAVSGGAPLPPQVARWLIGLGVPIVQGYGLTESAPIIAANALDDNDPSTVGRPVEGTEIRFGERQELQVRSASVMAGYWNRPDDTRAVLSADGWLSTGDQAELVDGRLRIVGRVKEIIVTSTGEKIAPVDVEQAISADPLFEQALVIGEGRPFMAAVVVLKEAPWRVLARTLAIDPADAAAAAGSAVREALAARVKSACIELPHYAVPRAVWPVFDAWTVENGLMTPTLKLKRNALMQRYASEIARLYAK